MSSWITDLLNTNFGDTQKYTPPNENRHESDRASYDSYGFSIKDEDLNREITKYEDKHAAKRYRLNLKWTKLMETQNFDIINLKTLKDLTRKGIPDNLRSRVWQKILGSDLLFTANIGIFDKLLKISLKPEIMNQIKLDVVRTFPTHEKFSHNETGLEDLRRVLHAFAAYFPSINYCQSINYIAAVLLLFLPPERAFWALVQMIESKSTENGLKISGYYKEGMVDLKRDIYVLDYILEERLKRVHAKFKIFGIDLIWICAEWFLCLFAISLPITTLLRVWDVLMLEGDKLLFRISFAIFKLNEAKILELDTYNSLLMYCKSMPKYLIEHDELLRSSFNDLRFFRRKDIEKLRERATERLKHTKN